MPVKTLHITNSWHSRSGGVATFYRELLRAAEDARRHMRLVVPAASDGVEDTGAYGRIYYVAARESQVSPGYRLLMPRHYLPPGSPLRRIVEQERPDLVEVCDKYALNYFAGLPRRGWLWGGRYRPAVVGLSCERMDDSMACYLTSRQWARRFCQAYMKWLYFPLFDHHIAVSDYTAAELRQASRGHQVRRGVWVQPMGVSCGLFHPGRRSRETRRWMQAVAGAPEEACLLVYAGRLAPEKNLGLLVDTLALLEDEAPGSYRRLMVGEGGSRRELEGECSRLVPGTVCFLGHLPGRQTLAGLLASADAFLHPNPREPFGLAPLEAMASGLPLVAPDCGGVTSFADPGNAWLVAPAPEAFAAAVREIQRGGEVVTARRERAHRTAQRYDWGQVTAAYFNLYDELCASVSRPCREPRIAPAFCSTAGNRLGWELQ